MPLETVLVYEITKGDTTDPHVGDFRIGVAGQVTIDDSNGSGDDVFGDADGTDSADNKDQDVTASTATGISTGDALDLRYSVTFTGDDGSSGTIYFLAIDGGAPLGTLIVSDTPLDPTVVYTFGTAAKDGAAKYDDLVPCFVAGTLIETDDGTVPVEKLRVGDLVMTLDQGFRPIRWLGSKSLDQNVLRMNANLRPIRIAAGALGPNIPTQDLVVSPQHRILLRSKIVRRMFDLPDVLVPAIKLTGLPGVSVDHDIQSVDYFHFLLDAHHLVLSDGAVTESLYTGPEALAAVGPEARKEILALFPELAGGNAVPPLVRKVPDRGGQTKHLIERHIKNEKPVQNIGFLLNALVGSNAPTFDPAAHRVAA